MRTAIDSNIFAAIWSGAPSARQLISQLGEARLNGALLISPFVFAELHAYPGATEEFLNGFLAATGVQVDAKIEERVWGEAGRRFARYAARRRQSSGAEPVGLLADFLIGTHALVQADRLFTLGPRRYIQDFPELRLL
jgi:predicted nucleic acid-binding protein